MTFKSTGLHSTSTEPHKESHKNRRLKTEDAKTRPTGLVRVVETQDVPSKGSVKLCFGWDAVTCDLYQCIGLLHGIVQWAHCGRADGILCFGRFSGLIWKVLSWDGHIFILHGM